MTIELRNSNFSEVFFSWGGGGLGFSKPIGVFMVAFLLGIFPHPRTVKFKQVVI